MTSAKAASLRHVRVDAATQDWRQGDCVLGEQWFLLRGDADPKSAMPDVSEVMEDMVLGLVVVTQTCDIVRSCETRPYVEVSPLVLRPNDLDNIRAGRRPNLAFIPGVAAHGLVADLDRTMTVTKNVVAGWVRVQGCGTDDESRALATALRRKRGRFAFPDDFTEFCRPLQERLVQKHGKESPEGAALRRLREVRVQATPDWDASVVELMVWFIRNRDDEASDWHEHLQRWTDLLPPRGRFSKVEGQVATLDDLTASEYLASDALDLDHLSQSK